MKVAFLLTILFSTKVIAGDLETPLYLKPGFVYKLECSGKLLASAVGNEEVLQLTASPAGYGCAVYLKALVGEGATNLILETSTGTITREIRIDRSTGIKTFTISLASIDRGIK